MTISRDEYTRALKHAKGLGSWLSAALEDPRACAEYKKDIEDWFSDIHKVLNEYIKENELLPCPECGGEWKINPNSRDMEYVGSVPCCNLCGGTYANDLYTDICKEG